MSTVQDFDFSAILDLPPILPKREMAAYESLWEKDGASFKRLAELFEENVNKLPSELVTPEDIESSYKRVVAYLERSGIDDYHFTINGTIDYPEKLKDAKYPLEFYYYRGNAELAFSKKSAAVVGSRKPSEAGIKRAKKLTKLLVENDFTIYSGLASGIDTVAHTTALEAGGKTVAVIGTPITESYPKENKSLQEHIAKYFLLISQVPILRYIKQDYRWNRAFFPERNATMSALSDATIIVEASDTSGTLIQARHALYQGRKLFILDNCFTNPKISWPAKFEKEGAIRVRDIDDILGALEA